MSAVTSKINSIGCWQLRVWLKILACFSGQIPSVGGNEEPVDKEAAAEEEKLRQEAIKEAEETRRVKHKKMEEERENMRQGIRDRVSHSNIYLHNEKTYLRS